MSEKVISASHKTLDIIEVLDQQTSAQVGVVAEQLDLPVSTVHGHLKTLKAAGYVTQEGTAYRLSLKFLNLGQNILSTRPEYRLARKYTDRIAEECGCWSIFGVKEDEYGVYVATSSGSYPEPTHEKIGSQFPLHTTAAGKVILANQSPDRFDELLENLVSKTNHSITSKDELRAEIETVRETDIAYNLRETDIAYNREESIEGILALAVPIRNSEDDFVGALAANVPKTDVDTEGFESLRPGEVQRIAASFESELEDH